MSDGRLTDEEWVEFRAAVTKWAELGRPWSVAWNHMRKPRIFVFEEEGLMRVYSLCGKKPATKPKELKRAHWPSADEVDRIARRMLDEVST